MQPDEDELEGHFYQMSWRAISIGRWSIVVTESFKNKLCQLVTRLSVSLTVMSRVREAAAQDICWRCDH